MEFYTFTRQKYSKDLCYWIPPKKFLKNLMNKISKGNFLRENFPLVLFFSIPLVLIFVYKNQCCLRF